MICLSNSVCLSSTGLIDDGCMIDIKAGNKSVTVSGGSRNRLAVGLMSVNIELIALRFCVTLNV